MSGGKKCKFFEECHASASVLIKHSGLAVCRQHFLANVESRVAHTVTRYHMLERAIPGRPLPPRERWVVAMSGGKDSQVLAEVLAKTLRERVELLGVYVDVGVRGASYTDESRRIVEETCARLGIPCTVVDLRGDGLSIDDIHVANRHRKGGNRSECAACGVVKRYHINRAAAELHADKVATGHHMTDEATMLVSNFLNVNTAQIVRGMPLERRQVAGDGSGVLLPRVKPFLEVSEEETALYAHLAAVPHVAVQCTYSADATTTVLKKHVIAIERDRPGTMLRLVRGFYKELSPILRAGVARPQLAAATPVPEPAPAGDEPVAALDAAQQQQREPDDEDAAAAAGPALIPCSKCGFPTTVPVCAYCKLRDQVVGFKAERPELFGGPGSNPAAHTCEVCDPPVAPKRSLEDEREAKRAKHNHPEGAAPVAPDIENAATPATANPCGDGAFVTTDLKKEESNRWKKRQRQLQRHAVKVTKAAAASSAAAAAAAPAEAAPAADAADAAAAAPAEAPEAAEKMETSS